MTESGAHEMYGLHLTGITGDGLLPAPAADTTLPRVVIRHARRDLEPECMGTQRAVLGLPGLRQLLLRRGEGTATFTGPRLSHDELIHPYLGAVASVFSRWCGREVYHAGAFVCGGLAWAVVGGREAGKSSLLAALAARGLPVLSDDLVVTDGYRAFCGPRTIDLRRLAPGTTAPVTPVRGASRWRLALPPVPGAVPLGGWIYLRWHADVNMHAVPASSSPARLAARRSWPDLPSDPEILLALATRPGWDLGRPANWAQMDQTVDLILETLKASIRLQVSARISTSPAPMHSSRKRATSWAARAAESP